MSNACHQLFPERVPVVRTVTSILTKDPATMKLESNVQAQISKLRSDAKCLVTHTSKPPSNKLCHLVKEGNIDTHQEHDMMNFRSIGQAEFEHTIQYYVLRTPSTKPPKHRKSLLTFTERKSRGKKVSAIEKERTLQLDCWKKRLLFASMTVASIPGLLITLPKDWTPTVVIMEGMFLININPWSAHRTFGDYGDFLMRQHNIICPPYRNGALEVHLLFDNPESQVYSPKRFEREQRDRINPVNDEHCCSDISEDMMIPPKWRDNIINCRKCKRQLVCFLTLYFVQKMKCKLHGHQRFVTAGGFSGTLSNAAVSIKANGTPQTDSRLECNVEETDMRI